MSETIAEAVTGTVNDLFGDASTEDAAQDAPVEAAAPEAEVATDEFPDWEAAGRDLFTEDPEDEPDFNALADAELAAEAEGQDVLAAGEYDDEQTATLKRQLIAERKKAEHFQRQHLTTARKAWEADVRGQSWGEFLPPDLSTLKAASHRDFKRQARQVAQANYAVLKPHLEKLQAERARLKQTVTVEAKQEVQSAWGRPTVGGGQVPAGAEQQAANELDAARKSRSMFRATKALIEGGQI